MELITWLGLFYLACLAVVLNEADCAPELPWHD